MPCILNSELVDYQMAEASPEIFWESIGLELDLIEEVFDERIRKHYFPQALLERKRDIEANISEFYIWHDAQVKAGESPRERMFQFEWQEIKKQKGELEKVSRQIRMRNEKTHGITDEMIQRAKDFPLESLVDPGRNRMVSCPGHEDNKPSCYIKNNYAYCCSCGRSWDTIEWVSDMEGLNFIEAVRRLQ